MYVDTYTNTYIKYVKACLHSVNTLCLQFWQILLVLPIKITKYREKIKEQNKPSLFDRKVIQTVYKGQNISSCGILHLHEAICQGFKM